MPGNTYWQLLVYISAVTTEFCPYLAPARLNSAMMYYTGVWNRSKIAVLLLVKVVYSQKVFFNLVFHPENKMCQIILFLTVKM